MAHHVIKHTVGNHEITLETGLMARQAHGAVVATCGKNTVLAAVVSAPEAREGLDFFPLTVNFEERMYAGGKIPGGFFRREGRPGESATLVCRMIDRPIRPLFPKGYRCETLVMVYTLSTDHTFPLDVLGLLATGAALMISNIPFTGPVAGSRVALLNGQFTLNPSLHDMEHADMDFFVCGSDDALMMVEGGANEIPEAQIIEGIGLAHDNLRQMLRMQEELAGLAAQPKRVFIPKEISEEVVTHVKNTVGDKLREAAFVFDKTERQQALDALGKTIGEAAPAEWATDGRLKDAQEAYGKLIKDTVRDRILKEGVRPDGRKREEIRPIDVRVGVLGRTHGSALFTRGQTQALSVTTLGTKGEAQIIDNLTLEDSKRYMHHYNFPPFCVGEARRLGPPGRREIGHGHLAERALEPMLPSEEEFPYTLRVVSEILESNGSSSMASVCGSSLSLMDAGVPIKRPVAGIAMGLVSKDGQNAVLSDIQGMEDALGDMDFKVAGTEKGITSLQMDIKIHGLSKEVMAEALEQARQGRMHILGKMNEVLAAARPELNPNAPRITQVRIDKEKIGLVIGPGGKTIRKLQAESETEIEVDGDNGVVLIYSSDAEKSNKAKAMIEDLVTDLEVGKIYDGVVKRILPIGAVVEVGPNKDGLVHISQISYERVGRVEDVLSLNQAVKVKVREISDDGSRVSLSIRETTEPPEGWTPPPPPDRDRGPRGGGSRDRDRGGDRPRYGDRDRGGDRPRYGDRDRGPRTDAPKSDKD